VREEKCEGRRPVERHGHKCQDNIKMCFEELGWEGMDLIIVAEDRNKWEALANMVMQPQVS